MTAPHHLVPPRRISRLLVANRGEIATRVFRTARDLGMGTVAVYSEPDAALPFVSDADLAVPLLGATPAQTYLDIDQLLAAARRTGADAVHPGYGFLAESAGFARAVQAAGLVWVGPSAATIERLGSKLEAKRVAAAAGVPLAPSAELGADEAGWAAAGEQVGFPLLVKASAGGGGRGMRLVEEPGDLLEAVRSARREAASAFGDGTVFLEHYLRGARHVEIQLLGDEQGSVVHLFERECSIQRRHQKIVEESPSPGTAMPTLRAMCAAAVTMGRAVQYVGVGTVEFLVVGDDEHQQFFFLEMNTRLQVEHAVTEMVTYKDLVKAQLVVAQGLPHGLSDGGFDRWEDDLDVVELPHDAAAQLGRGVVDGDDDDDEDGELDDTDIADHQDRSHAVEARLYAEDPGAGYAPSTGPVLLFEYDDGDTRVRWETTVATGSVVSPYYDALLAKVIAAGNTRQEAVAALTQALRGIRVHGVRTNRDQLVAILESAPFQAGGTPTDFLDLFPELVAPAVPVEVQDAHLVAAVLFGVRQRRAAAPLPFVPAGWRNVRAGVDTIAYGRADGSTVQVGYRLGADGSALVDIGGVEHVVRVHGVDDDGVDAVVDGVRRRCLVAFYAGDGATGPNGPNGADGDGGLVCVDGGGWSTQWVERPRFGSGVAGGPAASPTAPVPGTVTAVLVAPGDVVAVGQPLVVLEAMKMEHRVTASVEGSVDAVLVEVGQAVDAHDVLVTLAVPDAPQLPDSDDEEPADG